MIWIYIGINKTTTNDKSNGVLKYQNHGFLILTMAFLDLFIPTERNKGEVVQGPLISLDMAKKDWRCSRTHELNFVRP